MTQSDRLTSSIAALQKVHSIKSAAVISMITVKSSALLGGIKRATPST
jgi:hypothetical protein